MSIWRRRDRELRPFAYWHGEGRGVLSEFLAEWQAAFPAMRVLDDQDVEPMLAALFPERLALFRRIRIAAARADVARLVALYTLGGLYIDVHCGLRDRKQLMQLARQLDIYELILWERSRSAFPRPAEEHRYINGAMLARPRSSIVRDLLQQALANLAEHDAREAAAGHVEYSVWHLTGPGPYRGVLHEPDSANTRLRAEYRGRIGFASEEDGPIELWRHKRYRARHSQHWSQRQKTEPLLAPR